MIFWLTILVMAALLALVLYWNLHKEMREKLRGLTTYYEAAIGGAVWLWNFLADKFGLFADALNDPTVKSMLPKDWLVYVPIVIIIWMVIKRRQTTGPAGKQ